MVEATDFTTEPSPFQIIWLLDGSGSMIPDGNIQSVNTVLREAVPHLRTLALRSSGIRFVNRVLAFGSEPHWLVHDPIEIGAFKWPAIPTAERELSEMGRALEAVHRLVDEPRALTDGLTLLAVISDGWWTDAMSPRWRDAVAALDADPRTTLWRRVALSIGREPQTAALQAFVEGSGVVLESSAPQRLAPFVKNVAGLTD